MSVLVKGMEKPEHCGYCRFRYDGICHALQKTQYSMNECPLVVIDDAGLNDTISRQAAIDAFYQYPNINWTTLDVMEKIDKVPSAQPKKGKWHQRFYPQIEMMVCSECNNEFSYDAETGVRDYNFCPNCGADMRGENDETD